MGWYYKNLIHLLKLIRRKFVIERKFINFTDNLTTTQLLTEEHYKINLNEDIVIIVLIVVLVILVIVQQFQIIQYQIWKLMKVVVLNMNHFN